MGSEMCIRDSGRDTSPHHRHQSGRSWHSDRIHGQSYFLPADRTGVATGEEAVFWAVHPVQPDFPCDPAGRVVLAPLTVADDLWFFYKAKKGEFRHGRRSGQNSLWFYRMQLSSNGVGAGNSRDIAELLKGHGSFLSACFFYPTAEPPKTQRIFFFEIPNEHCRHIQDTFYPPCNFPYNSTAVLKRLQHSHITKEAFRYGTTAK